MRRICWFLRQFGLRWRYATREPYDLAANRALLVEIDRHYGARNEAMKGKRDE